MGRGQESLLYQVTNSSTVSLMQGNEHFPGITKDADRVYRVSFKHILDGFVISPSSPRESNCVLRASSERSGWCYQH